MGEAAEAAPGFVSLLYSSRETPAWRAAPPARALPLASRGALPLWVALHTARHFQTLAEAEWGT